MTDNNPDLMTEDLEGLVGPIAMRFFELSSRRTEREDDNEAQLGDGDGYELSVQANLQVEDRDDRFLVRMKVELSRYDAEITVDCGAQFGWSDGRRPSVLGPHVEGKISEVGKLFIEKVGLPYLVSYIRPALDQQARTMELPVLTLPLDYFSGASLSHDYENASNVDDAQD